MNKNEAVNFGKQYKNSVCLNADTNLVKLIECVEDNSIMYFVIQGVDGKKIAVLASEPLIPLRGRLKNRDYDFIVTKFHYLLN